MGLGGISIWQLLIVLLIVVLLFGTKKLKSLGTDLGGAVKGFKKAVTDENEKSDDDSQNPEATPDHHEKVAESTDKPKSD